MSMAAVDSEDEGEAGLPEPFNFEWISRRGDMEQLNEGDDWAAGGAD